MDMGVDGWRGWFTTNSRGHETRSAGEWSASAQQAVVAGTVARNDLGERATGGCGRNDVGL